MTATSTAARDTRRPRRRSGSRWRHVAVLTRRNLVHVRREPTQLSDATVQPVLFTRPVRLHLRRRDGASPAEAATRSSRSAGSS